MSALSIGPLVAEVGGRCLGLGRWRIGPGVEQFVEIAEFRRAVCSHDPDECRFRAVGPGPFRGSCPFRLGARFGHDSVAADPTSPTRHIGRW